MEGVITTLVWAALIQGVLLSFLYLFSRKYPSFANRLLGFFLMVIVYEGILQFIPYNFIGDYRIYYFGLPVVKLFYSVLFFHYILEKLSRANAYKRFLLIQYILAFGVWGLTFINLVLYFFTGDDLAGHITFETEESIFLGIQYLAISLIITVFVLSIREVRRYQRVVREKYSDFEMLQIKWMWSLILLLVPIIIVWSSNLIYIAISHGGSQSFELATWAFVVVFLYFVSYQAYKHKNLFEGVDTGKDFDSTDEAFNEPIKDDSEQVNYTVEQKELIDRIQRHMESQEPFLDASLSIYRLARELKMDVPELSALINHTLGKHFFDFVNEYRVKKAQEILEDPEHKKKTVLEILYEVGFNSKSSFNTVFKKFTGLTPTQYRKENLQMVQA